MFSTDVQFDLPIWVAKGIASGKYTRIGGVVRDNAGKIVIMLVEAGKRAPKVRMPGKVGLAVTGTVAVAGASYALYRMLTKEGQLKRRVGIVQREAARYSVAANEGGLTAEEVGDLTQALTQLEKFLRKTRLKDVPLRFDHETAARLREFLDRLVDFNTRIALSEAITGSPPEPQQELSAEELLHEIEEQLAFQLPLLQEEEAPLLH